MEQQEQIDHLSEAIIRISRAMNSLARLNQIHGPGNVVRIEIPKIGHLLSKTHTNQYKTRIAC